MMRRLSITFLFVGIATFLASCQDIGHKRINHYSILALAQACDAYTGALRVVTPLRRKGHLTPLQIKQVEDTIVATDIACADEPPSDSGQALLRVTESINILMHMYSEGQEILMPMSPEGQEI
jgi:hypothetical protein